MSELFSELIFLQAQQEAIKVHENALKTLAADNEYKLKREIEEAEKKLNETMIKLKEEHSKILSEEQYKLKLGICIILYSL